MNHRLFNVREIGACRTMKQIKMHSRDNMVQNIEAVGRSFQNAVTEVSRGIIWIC